MDLPLPEKVDADVVYRTLVTLGLRSDGDVGQQVARLVEHFGDRGGLVQCDECSGWSDPDLGDGCPFCGDGDDAPPAPTENSGPPTQAREEPSMKTDAANAPDDKPLRALDRPRPAVLPETSAASPVAQSQRLDAAVSEVKKLQRDFHASAWDVGRALTKIYEGDLWKARRDEKNAVRYANFEAFAREELGIGRKYAQDLLRIAARFTRDDVLIHGTTALRLVIQAPEQAEKEILEKLKQGAASGAPVSRRELERDVRQAVAESGDPTPEQKRAGKAAKTRAKNAKKTPAPKLAEGQITVAVVEGKKQLSKLYAKPTGKGDANNLRPATSIDDVPWGYLDLANDVRMFFTVVQSPAGELSIRHDFRRVK